MVPRTQKVLMRSRKSGIFVSRLQPNLEFELVTLNGKITCHKATATKGAKVKGDRAITIARQGIHISLLNRGVSKMRHKSNLELCGGFHSRSLEMDPRHVPPTKFSGLR
jgi:hypothetical protein